MILAAGRGERLRPLTDRTPKPLLRAGGKPLLAWHLENLARAGIGEVVINVSHLAARIEAHFGTGAGYGVSIAWSREASPLETAGGIAWALPLLGPEPFLLVNGDIWCDYELAQLTARPLAGRLAHLVLVPPPAQAPSGDFSLCDGIVGNDVAGRHTYSGIALLSPALVADVPRGEKRALAPLLRAAADRGAVSGELHPGVWRDAGAADRLAELRTLLSNRASP